MMRLFLMSLFAISLLAQKKQEIKVVVVTMFERGEDTGDAAGEFQLWVEREKLTQSIPFPQGNRALRSDGKGLIAMVRRRAPSPTAERGDAIRAAEV